MQTLIDQLKKESNVNDVFKMSPPDVLTAGGFIQTGTENGVPVFELADLSELTEDQIDQNDEVFTDYKD